MGIKVCPAIPLFTAHQQQAWKKACLPVYESCNPNPDDGVIKACEDTWNNVYCQTDSEYVMRYEPGDKIRFQTKFRDQWNEDPELPVDGWNVWIIARLYNDDTGALLSEDVADFASKWLVGWNGQESIQLIEVDTSKPIFEGVECWHIEFATLRTETIEEEEVTIIDSTACTEPFCNCPGCEEWPLLEAIVTGYDGHGYWHGELVSWAGNALFTYKPAFRFPLEIVQEGNRVERVISAGKDVSFSTSKVYTASTFTRVPPYISNMLALGYLVGESLIFAGKLYNVEDTTWSRTITRTEMLQFTFNLFEHGTKAHRDC